MFAQVCLSFHISYVRLLFVNLVQECDCNSNFAACLVFEYNIYHPCLWLSFSLYQIQFIYYSSGLFKCCRLNLIVPSSFTISICVNWSIQLTFSKGLSNKLVKFETDFSLESFQYNQRVCCYEGVELMSCDEPSLCYASLS